MTVSSYVQSCSVIGCELPPTVFYRIDIDASSGAVELYAALCEGCADLLEVDEAALKEGETPAFPSFTLDERVPEDAVLRRCGYCRSESEPKYVRCKHVRSGLTFYWRTCLACTDKGHT